MIEGRRVFSVQIESVFCGTIRPIGRPRKRALDDPAMAVAPQEAPIFMPARLVILAVRHDEGDAASAEALAQGIAVVAPIADQALGILSRPATERCSRGS